MVLPDKVNGRWIASLDTAQLIEAESLLRAEFVNQEAAEKKRAGSRYTMLRGPESLVRAWLRWLLVNNETHTRSLLIQQSS
jgi:hypothetical protein